jgi:hypothetical protein
MTEYGIFNDEGCIERGFWTEDEAGVALADYYADGEENLSIEALCGEHDEQPADSCEECFSEDDEDESD